MTLQRDFRDIVAGLILIILGSSAAIYALSGLTLGSLRQMGPGMFPVAIGCLVAVIGVFVLVPALARRGPVPQIDLRPFVAISASILAFALTIAPFGLFPSVILLVAIASRADSKLSPLAVLALGCGAAIAATLIFRIGLRLQIPLFAWPF